MGLLDEFGPLRDAEFHAQTDLRHEPLPYLVLLAIALGRTGCEFEHQRAAIGLLAPTVAIAVDVTVGVEQSGAPAVDRTCRSR